MNQREMFEQSFKRPHNFFDLTPAEQWRIDDRLDILDWDGGKIDYLTVEDHVRFFRHYNMTAIHE